MTIPQNYFIFITLGILLIYLVMIIIGYTKGFVYELVSLVYTVFALLAAWFISPILADHYPIIRLEKIYNDANAISKFLNLDPILNMIAYFVIVFLVLKVLYLLISLIVKSLNKIPVIGKINKVFGGLYGIINATLITFGISLFFTLPIFKNGNEVREKTILKLTDRYTKKALAFISDNADFDKMKKNFEDYDIDKSRDEFEQWLIENKIVSEKAEEEKK